ncbi:E3 ubiquitin ligase family protein [Phormidium sp. FACHB-1136]|uniref:E3 ubiquitin ligase family protein n=1 Tax=Phormidium sp. FACHB-1136 TaxID=2692848 RepID=UPI0016839C43|nr:E3 ubiquitin ligase family protein [Phormidium sp. FACHB-1136]MBD2428976.1 E3 ubiquitin ligase [Phormidium sp. FACHB-1136]
MALFGFLLLVAGGVLWFVRGHQGHRSRHLKLAHTTPIGELKSLASAVAQEIGSGDWRDYVLLWGTITTEAPLTSPMKGMPCVYYSNAVIREYEETIREQDEKGNWRTRTQRGSDTISQEQQSIPFDLVDQVKERVEVNPEGADVELVEVLNEFRPGQSNGGSISFGGFSMNLGDSFGGGNRRTLGYRYRESILAVGRQVTVLGMVSDRTGSLTVENPNTNQPFIISPKSQEALVKSATQNAQIAFWAMVGCLGLGAILLVVGLLS